MVSEQQKNLLRMMNKGEKYDEPWLLRQGNLTQAELKDLVDKGYLFRIDKNPRDFMSDNQYVLTDTGRELAWD